MKAWFAENIDNTELFEPIPEIQIWKFDKQKYTKNKKKISGFFLDSVREIRKFKPISDKYSDEIKYKLGMYIILDYKPNWVIFMYPTQEYNGNGILFPYTFANHYSEPFNIESTKKQIQFHRTTYIPDKNNENLNGERGSINADFDEFKNNIKLYLNSYEDPILNNKFYGRERECILDMLKFYRTYEHEKEDNSMKEGGGKTLGVSEKHKKISKPRKLIVSEVEEKDLDLEKAWRKYKLDHVLICAIKNKDTKKYGVTVTFYDHQVRHDRETHNGYFFIIDRIDSNKIKQHIITYIKTHNLSTSGLKSIMETDDEE
jgi:hypothetical protein